MITDGVYRFGWGFGCASIVFHIWWYPRQNQCGYISESPGEILKSVPEMLNKLNQLL